MHSTLPLCLRFSNSGCPLRRSQNLTLPSWLPLANRGRTLFSLQATPVIGSRCERYVDMAILVTMAASVRGSLPLTFFTGWLFLLNNGIFITRIRAIRVILLGLLVRGRFKNFKTWKFASSTSLGVSNSAADALSRNPIVPERPVSIYGVLSCFPPVLDLLEPSWRDSSSSKFL
jgi:hypothetical protein